MGFAPPFGTKQSECMLGEASIKKKFKEIQDHAIKELKERNKRIKSFSTEGKKKSKEKQSN